MTKIHNPKPRQKPTPPAETCGTCAHRWQADPNKPELFCRRYPPVLNLSGGSSFLGVKAEWLCGEWAQHQP